MTMSDTHIRALEGVGDNVRTRATTISASSFVVLAVLAERLQLSTSFLVAFGSCTSGGTG